MKTALEVAGLAKYMPTTHAIDRAMTRFGVEAEGVADWVNDIMAKADYIGRNDGGQSLYVNGDVRLAVNDKTRTVITVHSNVKTDFLRPTLERELRKLKRHYTRSIRKLELAYAESLRDMAEMTFNRARARNPQTRKLIAERIADKQAEISEYLRSIERLNDEWQAKVRAIEVISE